MKKNDFIEIIKMSIFLILMAALYSLYKFNFDFTKIKILPILNVSAQIYLHKPVFLFA